MRSRLLYQVGGGALFLGAACSGPDSAGLFEGSGSTTSGTASSVSTSSGGSLNATNSATASTGLATATTATSGTSVSSSQGGASSASATSSTATTSTTATASTTASTSSTATLTETASSSTTASLTTDSTSTETSGSTGTLGTTGTGTTTGSVTTGNTCVPVDELCDGIDNNCDGNTDETDVCPAGCHGASFESHVYVFCDSPPGPNGTNRQARNWQQALDFCIGRGQLLVSVESEAENAFVYEQLNQLSGGDDVWMGATDQDVESVWSWALGNTPESWVAFYDGLTHMPINDAFSDWREGEPNDMGGEDCGLFEDQGSNEWLWDDRACQTQFARLACEGSG